MGSSLRHPLMPSSAPSPPTLPPPAGKTFQCNLAYKKLGIAPIVMSAGELESGNAGEPAKLIRQRYREASDIVKKGKMASLFINDLVRACAALNACAGAWRARCCCSGLKS